MVVGLWRVEETARETRRLSQRVEMVRQESDERLCAAINQNRIAMRDIIALTASSITEPPDTPPSVHDILRQMADRATAFRAYAAQELSTLPCAHIAG
jgi:hypothetical protein